MESKISEAVAAVKGIDPIGIARLVVTERKYGPDAKRSFNPTTIDDILAEALLASQKEVDMLKGKLEKAIKVGWGLLPIIPDGIVKDSTRETLSELGK